MNMEPKQLQNYKKYDSFKGYGCQGIAMAIYIDHILVTKGEPFIQEGLPEVPPGYIQAYSYPHQ